MNMEKFEKGLKVLQAKTGLSSRELARADPADVQFVCDPTMQLTDPAVLSGPTLRIDRAGRTSILVGSLASKFSEGDRAVVAAMDLSESDYREFERELRTLPEAEKVEFKNRLDSALGLTETDYLTYDN